MSAGRKFNALKLAPGAVVCEEKSDLVGDITIGSRTVVHPKARIVAEAGPIIIGDNNLIEEQTQIINRHAPSEGGETNPNQTVMIIGNNNVFEVGCYSEALKIGDHNILEAKCRVGRQTILSNGCIVGAMCDVSSSEMLQENTVIYGAQCDRRVQLERPAPQTLQLDFLSKILPNYHHIVKPAKPKPK